MAEFSYVEDVVDWSRVALRRFALGNRATLSGHAKSLIIMQQSESGIQIMPAIELAYT